MYIEDAKSNPEEKRGGSRLPLEAVQLQTSTSELEALEKVRQILFGQQLEDQQDRLQTVSSQLSTEIANLRQQFSHHLKILESEFATEIQEVRNTLTASAAAQSETEKHFRESIRAMNDRVESIVSEMEGKLGTLRTDLSALGSESQNSSRQLREHLDRVDQLIVDLRDSKVDYTHLAGLFGDAAARLKSSKNA